MSRGSHLKHKKNQTKAVPQRGNQELPAGESDPAVVPVPLLQETEGVYSNNKSNDSDNYFSKEDGARAAEAHFRSNRASNDSFSDLGDEAEVFSGGCGAAAAGSEAGFVYV